jgi:hypothetical protein
MPFSLFNVELIKKKFNCLLFHLISFFQYFK